MTAPFLVRSAPRVNLYHHLIGHLDEEVERLYVWSRYPPPYRLALRIVLFDGTFYGRRAATGGRLQSLTTEHILQDDAKLDVLYSL